VLLIWAFLNNYFWGKHNIGNDVETYYKKIKVNKTEK